MKLAQHPKAKPGTRQKIGRAKRRERVKIAVDAGSLKEEYERTNERK